VVVHRRTQHFLGAFLPDDELVKVFFEHTRCYPRCAYHAGAAERTRGRLARLVDTSEGLRAEVRAVELRWVVRVSSPCARVWS
jgi:hypothetical protein